MEQVTIRCKVADKKPIFFSTTNYFTIARYQNLDNNDIFIASGAGLPKIENSAYLLTGNWVNHPKYGMQFKVNSFEEDVESTESNCLAYLSSGLVKGVGKKTAEKIVAKFGDKSLEILENDPRKYLAISGITEKKLQVILESYKETKSLKAVTALMSKYNLTLSKCMKIYDRYRAGAEDIIKNDTYKLCEIDGFGFITVDLIARDQNKDVLLSENRYRALVKYVLQENEASGSLYMNKMDFVHRSAELFNAGLEKPYEAKFIEENIYSICSHLIQFTEDNNNIGLVETFVREKDTAKAITDLMSAQSELNYVHDSYEEEKRLSDAQIDTYHLSDEQLLGVKMVMENNVSIITGGAGTGKTTVLKAILSAYEFSSIRLIAPTGRAAKRMEETTGHPASTIHSALGILTGDSTSSYDTTNSNMLVEDVIIVDETSMLDAFIAYLLFTHISLGSKVVLIGDVNQLPSVGAGNVLKELIDCQIIPTIHLTYNFRQSEGSIIADNANKILNCDTELTFAKPEFYLMDVCDDAQAANLLTELYIRATSKFGFSNVALITPFRKSFQCGVNSLNKAIQERINPHQDFSPECKVNGETFRIGDRVMQLKNRPYAMNGDIGEIQLIENIVEDGIAVTRVSVKFDGISDIVTYDASSIEELCLSYATTIHKSQGSEYKIVILAYENNSNLMLTRNLIYTAVTRARDNLVIVGQHELINMSIYKEYTNKRLSYLGKYIADYVLG